MSAITGYKAVIMATDRLPKFVPMIGTAIGTVKPARFLIIGAGVVGLQAVATAKRLGSSKRSIFGKPHAPEPKASAQRDISPD